MMLTGPVNDPIVPINVDAHDVVTEYNPLPLTTYSNPLLLLNIPLTGPVPIVQSGAVSPGLPSSRLIVGCAFPSNIFSGNRLMHMSLFPDFDLFSLKLSKMGDLIIGHD